MLFGFGNVSFVKKKQISKILLQFVLANGCHFGLLKRSSLPKNLFLFFAAVCK